MFITASATHQSHTGRESGLRCWPVMSAVARPRRLLRAALQPGAPGRLDARLLPRSEDHHLAWLEHTTPPCVCNTPTALAGPGSVFEAVPTVCAVRRVWPKRRLGSRCVCAQLVCYSIVSCRYISFHLEVGSSHRVSSLAVDPTPPGAPSL
eukprot:5848000-Prymnesium_polylepis.1